MPYIRASLCAQDQRPPQGGSRGLREPSFIGQFVELRAMWFSQWNISRTDMMAVWGLRDLEADVRSRRSTICACLFPLSRNLGIKEFTPKTSRIAASSRPVNSHWLSDDYQAVRERRPHWGKFSSRSSSKVMKGKRCDEWAQCVIAQSRSQK